MLGGDPVYKEILDKITWSFSSVNSFCTCKKMFFLTYIKKQKQIQNAFAEWGSFGHLLLEKYFTNRLELFEIASAYEAEYTNNVLHPFPPNAYVDLAEKYYLDGLRYFSQFEGLPEHYSVMAVEQKINLEIQGIPFVGFIDLILRDNRDDSLVIVDHKSKSKFKNKLEQHDYARQLYLYSLYIKEKYGEYPKELKFNMFRTQSDVTIPFDEKDLTETVQWFCDTVSEIYQEIDFPDKMSGNTGSQTSNDEFIKNDFFCNELCGVRSMCEQSICY